MRGADTRRGQGSEIEQRGFKRGSPLSILSYLSSDSDS
mgnify:CR=1 FL=1